MRTTLTLEEPIATALKNAAHRSGKPFKQVVNETLRAGLKAGKASASASRPYRLKPSSLGGLVAPVDLDKALQLADMLEDGELHRKLDQRK
jgi:hypothetical protein